MEVDDLDISLLNLDPIIRITWSPVSYATSYRIEGRRANGVWQVLGETQETFHDFHPPMTSAEAVFSFRVITICPSPPAEADRGLPGPLHPDSSGLGYRPAWN